MRLFGIILLIIFSQTSFGQVVNSLSADKTGMFYYAIDSLIHKVQGEMSIGRIILSAERSIIQDFPDTIRDVSIVKHDKNKEFRLKELGDNDILFKIRGLTVIRDQITVSIGTYKKRGKELIFFAEGAYIFYFQYRPATTTYQLTKVKSGIIL